MANPAPPNQVIQEPGTHGDQVIKAPTETTAASTAGGYNERTESTRRD